MISHRSTSMWVSCVTALIGALALGGCMRLEPDHPYDSDSPPEYRAPSSLISAIYTAELSSSFDYSIFEVKLSAQEYAGVYTRIPSEEGVFRFEGLPPGIYTLSVSGEAEGVFFGIDGEEVFLPVGTIVEPQFFRISRLE